jgi:hypothetical protein
MFFRGVRGIVRLGRRDSRIGILLHFGLLAAVIVFFRKRIRSDGRN